MDRLNVVLEREANLAGKAIVNERHRQNQFRFRLPLELARRYRSKFQGASERSQ